MSARALAGPLSEILVSAPHPGVAAWPSVTPSTYWASQFLISVANPRTMLCERYTPALLFTQSLRGAAPGRFRRNLSQAKTLYFAPFKAHTRGMDGVLYFDGYCGMCTRATNGLLRLNRTGRLQTEPMQRPGTAELLGVDADRLPESSWWLDSSGSVFAGAKAMNAALSTALGTRLPLRFYGVPAIGPIEEAVYRWVASHRYRFKGVTPRCESAPEQCSAPQAS
jgi:predicted DCC family thiol-disulfide oxidoreductase YuxK